MLIDSLRQLRGHPGERQAKQHFDGETVGGSIEIEERQPIHSFAQAEGSEYHSQPNQSESQTVNPAEFQRRFNIATVLFD
jgi:hypothetical protein